MQMVGVKELKDNLSHYLSLSKKGDNIIVTDRGTPVAILHSLDRIEKDADIEERLAALASQGKIKLPAGKAEFPPMTKPVIQGKPLSETVMEERR